ncbi:ATP-binding protein [Planctomicrobium sp. SH664]|uniref:ATP-binding protein n=1 Tax=Planctomicrobium sp. SH664 TaxID=3448125 RepID=UPI003F5AE9B9
MKLESITLKNFRAFHEETRIGIGDLTAIIGKNDVGKSSILEAMEVYFNNGTVKIESDDKHVHANEAFIEVTCEFSDIPEKLVLDAQAETTLQDEHLLTLNGLLSIKKRWRCTSGKPKEEVFVCANHPSEEKYNDLLGLTQTQLRERMAKLRVPTEEVNRNSNPAMRKAIWEHCPDLKLTFAEVPVAKEDGKQIWEKLSSHLPLFALFQSDRTSRDSDVEVQDPMKLAVATALAEPDIAQKLSEVVDAVRSKAVALAERTHKTLSKLDATLASELTPEFKADPKWAGLFSLALNCEDGIPVNKRGSGVRRLILVSFFRAEAERRLAEGASRSIIYAIEEPETAQHPNYQRILLSSFNQLAAEPNCQVLISTHSPGFASYLPIDCFRFVDREPSGRRHVREVSEEALKLIVESLGVVPDNRVKVLLCVEGPTDVDALKCLSHALHISDRTLLDLSRDPRIAFLVLGGGTLMHWVNQQYLRGLNRPEIHIYDSDVAAYGGAIQQVNTRTDGSWGIHTKKREIENYLHPDAIFEGIGCSVT